VAGGFGFTALPLKTARALGVDFGVQGEPDGFFERFDDVLAGNNLDATMPNLVYRKDGNFVANPRVFYSPSPAGEYNDEILAELVRFYGDRALLAGTMPHVPVEISREAVPSIATSATSLHGEGPDRSLPRLVRGRGRPGLCSIVNGIRRVWLVCSEINIHPAKAKELAARMAALNNGRSPRRPHPLARLQHPAHEHRRSCAPCSTRASSPDGTTFRPSTTRTWPSAVFPFRSEVALSPTIAAFSIGLTLSRRRPATAPRSTSSSATRTPMSSTIRTTLEKVESHGLQARHERAAVGVATRVFENDGKLICGDRQAALERRERNGQRSLSIVVGPSYYYPPKLVEHLGSEQSRA
jgi:hypothetical protein